jgi:hypothetical protein
LSSEDFIFAVCKPRSCKTADSAGAPIPYFPVWFIRRITYYKRLPDRAAFHFSSDGGKTMEELRIETAAGNFPLPHAMIAKYDLKTGGRAPFTGCRIVAKNGEYPRVKPEKKPEEDAFKHHSQEEIGVKAEDGVMLTASERIDFALGPDSDEK